MRAVQLKVKAALGAIALAAILAASWSYVASAPPDGEAPAPIGEDAEREAGRAETPAKGAADVQSGGAAGPAPGVAATDKIRIDAAGATFAFPLLDLWRVKYQEVQPAVSFNYQSIGSGGGVKNHIEETVNFGATDAPLTDAEYAAAPGTITIPEMIGAISVAFNVPGVPELNLSAEALCGMFLGDVEKWNDELIAADNPGAELPDEDIVTVHRSDGSGTTFAFTSYLSKTCPAWDERVGAAKSVPWPVGLGSPGNEGVANTIRSTDHSVGYVTLAYAFQNSMNAASIQNGDKTNFVAPSISTASAASGSAASGLPAAEESWRDVDILAAPGFDSYPITSFSYLILHPDLGEVDSIDSEAQAQAVVDMIAWIITDGQRYNSELLYVPIAGAVTNIGLEGLAQVTYNGKQLYAGPASVGEGAADSDELDAFIAGMYADYDSGELDQSGFLDAMARAAALRDLFGQDLIDYGQLSEALDGMRP